MATASSANPQEKAVTASARATVQRDTGVAVNVSAPSRREFLYYIWAASILMLLGQAGALFVWFIFPRFKEGEFGGTFAFNPEDIPAPDSAPKSVAAGRFHVTQTSEGGLLALYGVCTHLGCLPKWVALNNRFECPCHGSKFQLNGNWIEGPAPRALDRFVLTVTYTDGEQVVTPDDGSPIRLDPNKTVASVAVNTGRRILGKPH